MNTITDGNGVQKYTLPAISAEEVEMLLEAVDSIDLAKLETRKKRIALKNISAKLETLLENHEYRAQLVKQKDDERERRAQEIADREKTRGKGKLSNQEAWQIIYALDEKQEFPDDIAERHKLKLETVMKIQDRALYQHVWDEYEVWRDKHSVRNKDGAPVSRGIDQAKTY